jgi:hypothetical protein
MKVHELKCWPAYFQALAEGRKTCEVRRADRPFAEGDTLYLREWDPATQEYSGQKLRATVTHVLPGGQFGVEKGFVVLSVRVTHLLGEGK